MNKCFSEYPEFFPCCSFASIILRCFARLRSSVPHGHIANIGLFCTYIYIFNDFVIVGFQMNLSHSSRGISFFPCTACVAVHMLLKKSHCNRAQSALHRTHRQHTKETEWKKRKKRLQRLHSLCQSQPVYQAKCRLQHNIIDYSGARISFFNTRICTHGIKYF